MTAAAQRRGDTVPQEVARAQRQLTALQWVIPVLTGAVLVVNARMGEQQRPAQVSRAWSGGCSQVARCRQLSSALRAGGLKVAVGVLPVRAICRARPGRPPWSVQATSRRAGGRRTLEEQARRRVMVREGRLCAAAVAARQSGKR
jgi:hypothetical protein